MPGSVEKLAFVVFGHGRKQFGQSGNYEDEPFQYLVKGAGIEAQSLRGEFETP